MLNLKPHQLWLVGLQSRLTAVVDGNGCGYRGRLPSLPFLTKDVVKLKGGKKETVVRTARDIEVANSLIAAIDDALAGKYTGLGNYAGLGDAREWRLAIGGRRPDSQLLKIRIKSTCSTRTEYCHTSSFGTSHKMW
ncbi:hypothetical protein [Streptomyces yangpuensis]|uniref:hypothetical protein n=1 Tax=Streptomyces yangpuensis TaxID=1648182 RepID=UPI00381C8171